MAGETDVTVMSALVQGFVWATLVGFLYVIWLNNRSVSSFPTFDWSHHIRLILKPLDILWIAAGVSLIAMFLVTILPPLAQRASRAVANCSPTAQNLALPDADSSAGVSCGATLATQSDGSTNPCADSAVADAKRDTPSNPAASPAAQAHLNPKSSPGKCPNPVGN